MRRTYGGVLGLLGSTCPRLDVPLCPRRWRRTKVAGSDFVFFPVWSQIHLLFRWRGSCWFLHSVSRQTEKQSAYTLLSVTFFAGGRTARAHAGLCLRISCCSLTLAVLPTRLSFFCVGVRLRPSGSEEWLQRSNQCFFDRSHMRSSRV